MHMRILLTAALALAAGISAAWAAEPVGASTAQPEGLRALDGEWIYVEDRTENQPIERLGPPMASKFSMGVEDSAVILNGHGSGHRNVRIALDGSITEVAEQDNKITRYKGTWKDGTFEYEVKFEREPGKAGIGVIRRSFEVTAEGLVVRVAVDPPSKEAVGLYRKAEDIPLPTPAKAAMDDLGWLAGAWVGTRSSGSSIEERWSPPRGGAMLAVSRTVNTSGKMVAFEYLRIVERDGGLVYIAQPGGAAKTEFVLTEFLSTEPGGKRAVFDNPRHDYPKRIVYELSPEGKLTATTGYMKGGTPRRYEFAREGR